jgi:hypothetical protein
VPAWRVPSQVSQAFFEAFEMLDVDPKHFEDLKSKSKSVKEPMVVSAEATIYVVDASSWISVDGNPDANRILAQLDILIERQKNKMPAAVPKRSSQRIHAWLD